MAARLHYLYDQRGGGKERFVYFCSNCSCVLRVRRDLGPTGEALDSVNGRCFGCGRTLEGSIECRLTEVPDEWSDIYLSAPRTIERRVPFFRPASSFPHFSLGFPHLDSLLRPFIPGFMTVISGAEAQVVAELAAFRAQLPLEMGGLDSAVVFIDGGNRSDPYLFSSFARQHNFRPGAAMRRIATCRVFTMYQLADLVSNHLVPAAADYAAQLVVVSDILGTFNEPELEEREARRLLSSVEQAIRLVKKNALVLVTLVSPSRYDDTVVSWADTVVSLASADGRVRAELLKHPSKPQTVSSFRLGQLLRQKAVR
ncbi:MAG TPA: hypothetical protein VKF15_00910 [Nitrososphaerales archaeon]|nr:hypothetical protein [Nitrososphaerales archaeon]